MKKIFLVGLAFFKAFWDQNEAVEFVERMFEYNEKCKLHVNFDPKDRSAAENKKVETWVEAHPGGAWIGQQAFDHDESCYCVTATEIDGDTDRIIVVVGEETEVHPFQCFGAFTKSSTAIAYLDELDAYTDRRPRLPEKFQNLKYAPNKNPEYDAYITALNDWENNHPGKTEDATWHTGFYLHRLFFGTPNN